MDLIENKIIYSSYTESQKKAILKYYQNNKLNIQEKRRLKNNLIKEDNEAYEIKKEKQREASKKCYYKKLELAKNNLII